MSKPERVDKIRELSSQGFKADQIAPQVGVAEEHVRLLARESNIELPDIAIGSVRKIDVNRIIEQTTISAKSLMVGLELIDSRLDEIDSDNIENWITDLTESISALKRLISQLKKRNHFNEQQNGGQVRQVN
jgi:orotate phosphoribosyltransferase-like protein